MRFNISSNAECALDSLKSAGYEAYIVGGSVRNMYLAIDAHDYDITTSATPDETKAVFYKYPVIETGIRHGTVTVVINGENIEITTYRCESGYSDSRHPDKVEFTRSLEEDLSRRDFTVNALAYDGDDTVVDLFGGVDDIKKRLIRAIGDPYERFNEDALRILRAARFSSVLGFEIEENTFLAMVKCKHLLAKISKERIAEEINKLLCGEYARDAILKNWEILAQIIPEIGVMHGFDQKNKHHIYDILTHTAVAVASVEATLHLRLAALLHDAGKPGCVSTDEAGSHHFYGHPHKSEEIARRYLNEYKYDNFTKERVLLLVKIHDTVVDEDKVYIKKRLNRIGKDAFFELISLQRADNRAQSPIYDRGAHFDEVERIAHEVIDESECFSLKDLKINGSDLIDAGFPKGKIIGDILSELLTEVMEEKIKNDKAELLNLAEKRYGHYAV